MCRKRFILRKNVPLRCASYTILCRIFKVRVGFWGRYNGNYFTIDNTIPRTIAFMDFAY